MGKKYTDYQKQADTLGLPVTFHGFLERKKVFEIYKKSHFLMLPSTASEGFPKVIAESMNFGCIPIVSAVSSIGQYINSNNGYIIDPCTAVELQLIVEQLLITNSFDLKFKAIASHQEAKDFTFENYRQRIKTDILV